MLGKTVGELAKLGFEEVGRFSGRRGKLELVVSKFKSEKGCYAFVVGDTVRYIGVTKNSLTSRMNGYKNPGPSQQTNRRVNPKIRRAQEVKIFFMPESRINEFNMSIQHGEMRKDTMLDLSTFERFMISFIQPPWNRE